MLLLPLAASVTAQIPPRSISTPKEEVDDAFLSYLHGILYNDAELRIDGETLSREFPEFVPSRPTPPQVEHRMDSVSQRETSTVLYCVRY